MTHHEIYCDWNNQINVLKWKVKFLPEYKVAQNEKDWSKLTQNCTVVD